MTVQSGYGLVVRMFLVACAQIHELFADFTGDERQNGKGGDNRQFLGSQAVRTEYLVQRSIQRQREQRKGEADTHVHVLVGEQADLEHRIMLGTCGERPQQFGADERGERKGPRNTQICILGIRV